MEGTEIHTTVIAPLNRIIEWLDKEMQDLEKEGKDAMNENFEYSNRRYKDFVEIADHVSKAYDIASGYEV